jgi:hypothetical protein
METQNIDYLSYALRQSQKLSETLRMAYKNHDHDENPSTGMVLAGLVSEAEAMSSLLLAVIMAKNTEQN